MIKTLLTTPYVYNVNAHLTQHLSTQWFLSDTPICSLHVNDQDLGNHTLRLKCRCTANPIPTIQWYAPSNLNPVKNSTRILVTTKSSTEDQDVVNGFLVIQLIDTDDSGDYKCVCENEFGGTTATYHLVVHQLTTSTTTNDPGMNIGPCPRSLSFSILNCCSLLLLLFSSTNSVIYCA